MEGNLGWVRKSGWNGSPDWTMLITNLPCLRNRMKRFPYLDDFRNFLLNEELAIRIDELTPAEL